MMNRGNKVARIVKLENVAAIFKTAYLATATIKNAESAFTHTCIWPYSYLAFLQKHFPNSKVLDAYRPPTSPASSVHAVPVTDNEEPEINNFSESVDDSPAATDQVPSTSDVPMVLNDPPSNANASLSLEEIHAENASHSEPVVKTVPSPESYVSPSKLIPCAKTLSTVPFRSKCQKSEILTSSPFKDNLEFKTKYEEEVAIRKDLQRQIKELSRDLRVALNGASTSSSKRVNSKRTKTDTSSTPANHDAPISTDCTNPPPQKRAKRASSKNPNAVLSTSKEDTSSISTKAASSTSTKPEKYVDCQCLFCQEKYSESRESWIQCIECEAWAHTSCADVPENIDIAYVCDLCREES